MKFRKLIVNICFGFLNFFYRLLPIKNNRISFISLESKELEADQKLIYDGLKNRGYDLRIVSLKFDKNTLWSNFQYFMNMFAQLYAINTSKLVIINYNNYLITKFKKKGVIVLQLWHAAGAIKKFGNAIEREYPVQNYDYVIANSDAMKSAYAQAFGIKEEQVIVCGMPSMDELLDQKFLTNAKAMLTNKYPVIKDKKVILYAPTFRGNIYESFHKVDIDLNKLHNELGKGYIIMYKLHPLMIKDGFKNSEYIINVNNEILHELFAITDILVSDYSSVVFDYSLLHRPIYYYAPDFVQYEHKIGYFIDYKQEMKASLCISESELIDKIKANQDSNHELIYNKYMKRCDGNSLKRCLEFIEKLME